MSEMRQAKYCPQCGTMARIETPVCQTCGHQFHTGVPEPVLPEDDDEFNKTQLFMMSPVLMHRAPEVVPPLPVGDDQPVTARKPNGRAVLFALGAILLLAALVWGVRLVLGPRPAHPNDVVGRWTRATASGTVGLMFAADGSGALFWQPTLGQGAGDAGNVALKWRQTSQGMLKFTAAAPVSGGPEVQQSVQLLESQPWTWDSDGHTLSIGKLTFDHQGQ